MTPPRSAPVDTDWTARLRRAVLTTGGALRVHCGSGPPAHFHPRQAEPGGDENSGPLRVLAHVERVDRRIGVYGLVDVDLILLKRKTPTRGFRQ